MKKVMVAILMLSACAAVMADNPFVTLATASQAGLIGANPAMLCAAYPLADAQHKTYIRDVLDSAEYAGSIPAVQWPVVDAGKVSRGSTLCAVYAAWGWPRHQSLSSDGASVLEYGGAGACPDMPGMPLCIGCPAALYTSASACDGVGYLVTLDTDLSVIDVTTTD